MTAKDEPSGLVHTRIDRAIDRGAAAATKALSQWLGREAHVSVNRVRLVELEEATGALGPEDAVVAACAIPLNPPLPGTVLMTFDDRSAMAMIDALLGQSEGSTTEWGSMERSAARETANIVVCAFINALAREIEPRGTLTPGPPEFRLEFAGSLLEFTLIDQASRNDRIMLVETRFSVDGVENDWSLIIVPEAGGLDAFGLAADGDEGEDRT